MMDGAQQFVGAPCLIVSLFSFEID